MAHPHLTTNTQQPKHLKMAMLVGLIFQQLSRGRHRGGQRLRGLPVGLRSTFEILGAT